MVKLKTETEKMQDGRSSDAAQSLNSQPVMRDGRVFGVLQGSPVLLESERPAAPQAEYVSIEPRRKVEPWVRLAIIGVASILLLAGSAFFIVRRISHGSQLKTGSFGVVSVPLGGLTVSSSAGETVKTLKVNGSVRIAKSIILTPTSQPTNAITGQLYYDQTSNHLAYYNGQGFVNLSDTSGTVTNVTNITNLLTGTGAGVQLQTTSPGVQQAGNFNVSGVGKVGTLKTTVIDSEGGTLYVNPLSGTTQQQIAPGTPATVGLTSGSGVTGPGWNDDVSATKITMGSVGGTAKSISVFFGGGSASKHVQLALYDDDGDLPSQPSNLLAVSAVANLVPNGITTINIPSVNLSPSTTYWLAVNTDDNTVTRTYNGGNKASCFRSGGFGFMPDPFGGCFFDNNVYTIYLNYTVGSAASGTFSQAALVIGATGQAVFRNATDSTTAFQVQNAIGTTTLFNVDTLNGRIGIGKTTPTFKLDIAAGDINLSNSHSLRFGGLQTLTVNSGGATTSLTNFTSGGSISVQADNFMVQDANATHQSLAINDVGAATFSNRVDSAAAFQVQNAAAASLLRADASGMKIIIGNPAGDNNPVVLYLSNKNTAGDPAGAEGGTYYNSTLASFRCFYGGFWQSCADKDPRHTFSLYDEFAGGQTSFAGQIGSLGWSAAAIGANGSLALNPATPTPSADRPGILQLQTPAVANQGTTLSLGDASGGSMIIAKDNDVKVAVAAGAATGQVLRIGLHNETTTTTQPLSGAWWEADPAASANWRYCYGDGTTATCAASAVAIAANTWVTLEIRITATGNGTSAATFVINNTPFQVVASTIDTTGRVSPALSCYTTSAAARNCYWDYFQLTGTTGTAR